MSQPSQRQRQVADEIKHILLKALSEQRFHSTVLDRGYLAITEVRMSPDLKLAKVYFAPLLSQEDAPAIKRELTAAKGQMKKLIAAKIRMKFTPDLSFIPDDRPDGVSRIDELLSTETVKKDIT